MKLRFALHRNHLYHLVHWISSNGTAWLPSEVKPGYQPAKEFLMNQQILLLSSVHACCFSLYRGDKLSVSSKSYWFASWDMLSLLLMFCTLRAFLRAVCTLFWAENPLSQGTDVKGRARDTAASLPKLRNAPPWMRVLHMSGNFFSLCCVTKNLYWRKFLSADSASIPITSSPYLSSKRLRGSFPYSAKAGSFLRGSLFGSRMLARSFHHLHVFLRKTLLHLLLQTVDVNHESLPITRWLSTLSLDYFRFGTALRDTDFVSKEDDCFHAQFRP